jgi:two-component system, LytTR family, response regulator
VIRAYLVDDEPLALKRLTRMLEAYPERVRICGSNTDPVNALDELRSGEPKPDVLFLDIHMPGLSGFELLAELTEQPMVIFTTAYDQYALDAFRVNSIDYLLKPIEPEHLDRALNKAERMSGPKTDLSALLRQIGDKLGQGPAMERIASRSGDKVELVEIRRVTHFFASGKLTFAAAAERNYVVDQTISELEHKLDPARFVRIHRGVILNLDHLQELHPGFSGSMVVRLKNPQKTELPVSRDRMRALKSRLGL